ncbi:hypothetical protein TNCV_3032281 [Trichonephila clavipes]|nr:hypothetical protein TNCV_3032281 [Trichonephila clavipes]
MLTKSVVSAATIVGCNHCHVHQHKLKEALDVSLENNSPCVLYILPKLIWCKIGCVSWASSCATLEVGDTVARDMPLRYNANGLHISSPPTSRRAACPLVGLVEEVERWKAPDNPQGVLPQKWGETEQKCTVTCMVIKAKANGRRKNQDFTEMNFMAFHLMLLSIRWHK